MTSYAERIGRINDHRRKIQERHKDIRNLQADIKPRKVENYSFSTSNGPVRLADLFGAKNDQPCHHQTFILRDQRKQVTLTFSFYLRLTIRQKLWFFEMVPQTQPSAI